MTESNLRDEPQTKKAKEESSMLAGMAKMVNKPQQNREDV